MKALLKPEEVCDLLRISKFQLCRMSKQGKIPCVNVSDSPKNATWRYDEDELAQWLNERRRGSQRKAEVRRRIQASTPVQRGINAMSQPLDNKSGNGKAHGTEHPVNGLDRQA